MTVQVITAYQYSCTYSDMCEEEYLLNDSTSTPGVITLGERFSDRNLNALVKYLVYWHNASEWLVVIIIIIIIIIIINQLEYCHACWLAQD